MNIVKNTFSVSPLRFTSVFMGMAAVWLFAPEIVHAAVTFGEMGENVADNAKGVAKGITLAGYAAGAGMEVRKFEFPKIGSLAAPYRACLEILQKENPGAIDASRMDSLLALHMRLAGYTPQETANEMYRQARPLRREKENRDWIDYARRMVWYAFGAPGDIDLAAAKPTKELIQTFQREAERIEAERQKPKPPEEQPQYRMRMR